MPVPALNGAGGFDSAFYAAYKHIYNQKRIERLAYTNRPFFKLLTKKDIFEGDAYHHSIFFEDPQGGSQNFAQAIAQKAASSQGARMVISRGREYQALTMDNEAIRASRSDMGSLLRKKTSETDRVLSEMCRRIDIALHGDGSGIVAAATTPASVSGSTLTLTTAQSGIRFSVGMWVQFATAIPAAGTAPTLVSQTAYQVTGRVANNNGSSITFGQTLSAMGLSASTTYQIVRAGCGIGFGTSIPAGGGVSGLKAWLPLTAPVAGDNFWGVDRSVDTQRLAGSRYTAAGGEKYEVTFQNASAELELQCSTADTILMNPYNLAIYTQELAGKTRYMAKDPAVTGLDTGGGYIVHGQSGNLKVVADPQVDVGTFYILDSTTWWLATLDAVPHLDQADGLGARRETGSDGQEIRWRAWYQLVCDMPGRNMVGTFGY